MTKKIPLANNRGYALVDDEDYEELSKYKWFYHCGYAKRNGKMTNRERKESSIFIHRQIMGLKKGDGIQVDHINGNRLDNRKCNLRRATNQQNCFNQRNKPDGTTSRYKGVSWSAPHNKWQVHIVKNGRRKYLGLFDNEKEAAIAYDFQARKLFGEFAGLNFPDVNRKAKGRAEDKPKGISKYWGVYWNPKSKRWYSKITIRKDGIQKHISLGAFDTEIEAAKAFDEAVIKFRGKNARTNF